MLHSQTYSTPIFDTFGVLSSFSLAEPIWNKYEVYAIPKIEDATIKLRGSLYYLKGLTPEQAHKEIKSIEPLIPIMSKLRNMFEPIVDQEFQDFKSAAIEFFNMVDLLHNNLQDIANVHGSYEMAMPVLSGDWDRNEDDHWDNY